MKLLDRFRRPKEPQEEPSKKILATSALIGATLLALLGGLALVVRALRNVDLDLDLNLKKDDASEQKF
jgi:hypothetical protein